MFLFQSAALLALCLLVAGHVTLQHSCLLIICPLLSRLIFIGRGICLHLVPFVATKTACVDAHIYIPSCIDVWLHLQCLSAEEAQAAMGTLIYEGQGRCDVSHCGYREKEGQAYIPSGSHFLRTWLYLYEFVLSICLWAESLQPAMRMVWSHISVAGGLWDSVGIPHFPLLLLLIEKHNLPGLGCEKQEWKHFHIARW